MFHYRPDPGSSTSNNGRPVLLIKGGYNLAYDCQDHTPMILTIHIRPEAARNLVQAETFTLYPDISYENYIDSFGNKCTRSIAPPGRLSIWNRFVIADGGLREMLPINAAFGSATLTEFNVITEL